MRKIIITLFLILFIGPIYLLVSGTINFERDWRTADRRSSGIAPLAEQTPEALVQIYAARAFNWRGVFAVHCWIATKAADADQYEISQVLGWQKYRQLPVLVQSQDWPDRRWYGEEPELLLDLRGEQADAVIDKVRSAVASYPYKMEYHVWPGPNSNTFVAWVGRQVPELELQLPATAVGKDFLPDQQLFAPSISGSGYQFSLFGLLGVQLARVEGLEFNLLGLSFGLDLNPPALILPGLDRLSWPQSDHQKQSQ